MAVNSFQPQNFRATPEDLVSPVINYVHVALTDAAAGSVDASWDARRATMGVSWDNQIGGNDCVYWTGNHLAGGRRSAEWLTGFFVFSWLWLSLGMLSAVVGLFVGLAGFVFLALFVGGVVDRLLSQSKSLRALSGFWLCLGILLRVVAVCRRASVRLAVVVLVCSSGACCARFGLLGWGVRFQGLCAVLALAAATARQFPQWMSF